MPSFAEDLLKKAEEYLDKGEYKVAEGIAERFFHDFAGWTMMPMAFDFLAAELWLLARLVVTDSDPSTPARQPA
jgi:hypothetical protein